MTQQQTRYNLEISSLREQLHEAETHRDLLEREVGSLYCKTRAQAFFVLGSVVNLFFRKFYFSFVFVPRQVQLFKEKLDKSRSEAVSDFEQMMTELNRRNEREKQVLLEDNKKLSSNVEFVSFICFSCHFHVYIRFCVIFHIGFYCCYLRKKFI